MIHKRALVFCSLALPIPLVLARPVSAASRELVLREEPSSKLVPAASRELALPKQLSFRPAYAARRQLVLREELSSGARQDLSADTSLAVPAQDHAPGRLNAVASIRTLGDLSVLLVANKRLILFLGNPENPEYRVLLKVAIGHAQIPSAFAVVTAPPGCSLAKFFHTGLSPEVFYWQDGRWLWRQKNPDPSVFDASLAVLLYLQDQISLERVLEPAPAEKGYAPVLVGKSHDNMLAFHSERPPLFQESLVFRAVRLIMQKLRPPPLLRLKRK